MTSSSSDLTNTLIALGYQNLACTRNGKNLNGGGKLSLPLFFKRLFKLCKDSTVIPINPNAKQPQTIQPDEITPVEEFIVEQYSHHLNPLTLSSIPSTPSTPPTPPTQIKDLPSDILNKIVSLLPIKNTTALKIATHIPLTQDLSIVSLQSYQSDFLVYSYFAYELAYILKPFINEYNFDIKNQTNTRENADKPDSPIEYICVQLSQKEEHASGSLPYIHFYVYQSGKILIHFAEWSVEIQSFKYEYEYQIPITDQGVFVKNLYESLCNEFTNYEQTILSNAKEAWIESSKSLITSNKIEYDIYCDDDSYWNMVALYPLLYGMLTKVHTEIFGKLKENPKPKFPEYIANEFKKTNISSSSQAAPATSINQSSAALSNSIPKYTDLFVLSHIQMQTLLNNNVPEAAHLILKILGALGGIEAFKKLKKKDVESIVNNLIEKYKDSASVQDYKSTLTNPHMYSQVSVIRDTKPSTYNVAVKFYMGQEINGSPSSDINRLVIKEFITTIEIPTEQPTARGGTQRPRKGSLESLVVKELRERCKKRKIKIPKGATKKDIIALLRKKRN
jgi:hypothetical protein